MKVQVQKEKKGWAHEGYIEKKEGRKIAMFQNNIKRDHIYKRIIVSVYLFPHTCRSSYKSMALLSLDPWFDFTTYAIQVYYIVYPYLKLHIKPF